MAKIIPRMLAVCGGAMAFCAPASATGIAFDCDVPPDHYSSVSQEISGPMAIAGSVQLIHARSGGALPVAGGRLVSPDGKNGVGFQIVAASTDTKQLDVLFNSTRNGQLKRATVAKVAADTNISFALSLDDRGVANLSIAGKVFSIEFMPLPEGNGMLFCSTGQFKFTAISFHPDDDAGED